MELYSDYNSFLKKQFSEKVQKISVNGNFTCPNRNGQKGFGGCSYCNNVTFHPDYCKPEKSIMQQINEGILFFAHKYPKMKYLAYFQSYTNTYKPIHELEELYKEALKHEQVLGLVIGTRPDCINLEIIEMLDKLAKEKFILLEFGVETCNNETLKLINRQHSFEDTCNALEICKNRHFFTGAHFILGLPGETYNMIINHAKILSKLPIHTLKLHHLQIIKGTKIVELFEKNPELFLHFTVDSYIELVVEFMEHLRSDIVIERFIASSPKNLVISPKWNGIKNFEITHKIEKALQNKNTWQGKKFSRE